jgi:hypothetical protein
VSFAVLTIFLALAAFSWLATLAARGFLAGDGRRRLRAASRAGRTPAARVARGGRVGGR